MAYNNYGGYNTEPTNQVTKYNDASLSIQRLHNHWVSAVYYKGVGNLKKWKFILDDVWLEIYPNVVRMKKSKPKQAEKIISMNTNLKIKIAQSKNPSQLYNFLYKRHEFLREVQDLAGKGDVYVDEDEEGFE